MVFLSLLFHVGWTVRKIEVVIDRVLNLAWNLNLGVQRVKLDVEFVHVELLFLILELGYRVTIFISGGLVVRVLFGVFLLFLFVLLITSNSFKR